MTTGPHDTYAEVAARRGIDLDAIRAPLAAALATHLGARDLAVHDLRTPAKAGTSSGTILFTAAWSDDGTTRTRDLVVRTEPDKVQMYRDADFRRQYAVIETLYGSGLVRVPEPYFFEADRAVLGVPFFVMEQLHGNVPVTMPGYNVSGWLFDATPAQRRVTWETAMEELCRIARVPVADVPFLDDPHLGGSGVEQQLEYWRASVDWATGDQTPDKVWDIHAWLAANLPVDRTNGFAWGDARIGNMMFGADFRLAGVMDWEAANLSGPRQDLAWWVLFDEFNAEARGVPRLAGLGSREETIAFWEDRVGETAGDLHWYEVFTAFQLCLFMYRSALMLGGDMVLEANQGYRMACERLGW